MIALLEFECIFLLRQRFRKCNADYPNFVNHKKYITQRLLKGSVKLLKSQL